MLEITVVDHVGFSEEKIIAALKQGEAGVRVSEIVRKLGISEATFCNSKAKYGRFGCVAVAALGDFVRARGECSACGG